jgi:hypothetical protein
MRAALALIAGRAGLEMLPGGHDLAGFRREGTRLAEVFSALMGV